MPIGKVLHESFHLFYLWPFRQGVLYINLENIIPDREFLAIFSLMIRTEVLVTILKVGNA